MPQSSPDQARPARRGGLCGLLDHLRACLVSPESEPGVPPASRPVMRRLRGAQDLLMQVRDQASIYGQAPRPTSQVQLVEQCKDIIVRLARHAAMTPDEREGLAGYVSLKAIDERLQSVLDNPAASGDVGLDASMRKQLLSFRLWVDNRVRALEVVVPKVGHFYWTGQLGAVQKAYMAFWIETNPDHRFYLWYDPEALLVNELKRSLVRQAHAESNDPHRSPTQQAEAVEVRILALQDQAQAFIAEHSTQPFDEAAAAFMVRHLGADPAELARLRTENQKSFTELGALEGRVVLKSVKALNLPADMQLIYRQERDLRQQPAAMSDIARLQILQEHGGLYLDVDLLPLLHPDLFGAVENEGALRAQLEDTFPPQVLSAKLAQVKTRIVLDELARRSNAPADNMPGSASDPVRDFTSQHGQPARTLVARYRQAVAGQPLTKLFKPIGDIRVVNEGLAVVESPHVLWLNAPLGTRHWLNAAIAAAPHAPMLEHVQRQIAQRYASFLHDPLYLDLYRRDGFASAKAVRQVATASPAENARRKKIGAVTMITALTGPQALEEGVADYLVRQGALSEDAQAHPLELGQFISPLANLDTPEGKKSSWTWMSGPTARPADLYADGSNYQRQLIVQIGHDDAVSTAARFLHNKHQASSAWVAWQETTKTWTTRAGDRDASLPGNSRITLVAHGQVEHGELRLGGLTAAELSARLGPLLPGREMAVLRLVGCHGESLALREAFVAALWAGLDAQQRPVKAIHIGGSVQQQVDVFGRKWGRAGDDAAWHRPSTKWIYQRRPNGQLHVTSAWRMAGEGSVPPGASGPLAHPPEISRPLLGASGMGLRLYGAYRTFGAVAEALKLHRDDLAAIAIGGFSLSLVAEAGERGLTRLGLKLVRSSAASGRLLLRAAPLANLLNLPFDLYDATRNFSQATRLSGKARQDALVAGGFAVASIFSTLGVTALALAGVSAAGPIGLAAAVGLIVAGQTYAAVRQVEEIERWIPLSFGDKLHEGARAFFGRQASDETQERIQAAHQAEQLDRQAQQLAEQWLQAHGFALILAPKIHVEAREYARQTQGRAMEALVPPAEHAHRHLSLSRYDDAELQSGRQRTCKDDVARAGSVEIPGITCPLAPTTTRHFEHFIADSDDTYDFSAGIDRLGDSERAKLNLARAKQAQSPWVLLDFGHGDDRITGVRDAPNLFRLGSGSKTVAGGEQDDVFLLDAAPALGADSLHSQASRQAQANRIVGYRYDIDGGAGQDTLVLDTDLAGSGYSGYQIDLAAQSMVLLRPGEESRGRAFLGMPLVQAHIRPVVGKLRSIEHIHQDGSARHESRHRLLGNAEANQLYGRSRDHLAGREGHDVYHVALAEPDDQVSIQDDNRHAGGQDEWATVRLDLTLAQLDAWFIERGALVIRAQNGATLTVQNLYRNRQLQNNRFVFFTRDGFQLVPELPAIERENQALAIGAIYLSSADVDHAGQPQGVKLDLARATLAHAGAMPVTFGGRYRLRAASGTPGDDVAFGSRGDDVFFSSAGHDFVAGRGGQDLYFIDDSAGQTDIDTGLGDDVSALQLSHARLDQLVVRLDDDGKTLLINTPHGKTLRHLDSAHAAPLSVLDADGARLDWLIAPEDPHLETMTQTAAITGSRLVSHAAAMNLLVGQSGDDVLEARHGATVLYGGGGADTYEILVAGDFLIDGADDNGQADHLRWHGHEQGSKLRAERVDDHLVLGCTGGASTVTLAGYYRARTTPALRISLLGPQQTVVESLTAETLQGLAQCAPMVDLGDIDRQLQRLIAASSRFGAEHGTALALSPPIEPAQEARQLAVAL